jgi:C1A family cysteine protease
VEGAYQIATGALRSLSEQQLIDCSQSLGNMGCKGGQLRMGFDYIKVNKGIDSEDDYPFTGANGECWTTAAKRVVATIDSFTAVTTGSEAALVAAAALGPVSVAIEADQPAFQHYKSGVFDAPCGTKLDHGVLLVGYDADSYTVKNRREPSRSTTACLRRCAN